MNTTTSVLLTGALVIGTYIAEGRKFPPKVFVGMAVLIIILAALSETNAKFAQQFGLLILVAAGFTYGQRLAAALKKAPATVES